MSRNPLVNLRPFSAEAFYAHFPYCETRCHYCDFYSIATDRVSDQERGEVYASLPAEIALWQQQSLLPGTIKTLFFGGGTPSLADPKDFAAIRTQLGQTHTFAPDYEWTIEANPSSIEAGKMQSFFDLGVNRVSIGMQATRDDQLKMLGRPHNWQEGQKALDSVFEAGFQSVSVDLLCGVPGQTIEDLHHSIEALFRWPITHLSCYLLTLTSKNILYKNLPDEDTQLAHLEFIDAALKAKGFQHYEISNFSKPGFEARHNLSYWKGDPYLSFGPSAHSFAGRAQPIRWKNISSATRHRVLVQSGQLPVEQVENLTPEQLDLERWLLGLRLSEGAPWDWLVSDQQKSKAQNFTQMKWIEQHPGIRENFRLTVKGLALSEQIIAELA